MKVKNLLNTLPDNSAELRERQQDLMDEATPALREKVQWVVDWCKRDTKNSLVSRWELGDQINEVFNDHSRGAKRFGNKPFQTIAAFSGEAEGSLRVCAKLAKLYTRGQILDISEMVMADGTTPLSFSHIRCVLTLDDPATGETDRQEALNLALERCWTVETLSKYVVSKAGGGTQGHKGRPVAKPKNVEGILDQQLSFINDFEKRNVSVWGDAEHSVTSHLTKMPPNMYTEALEQQLAISAQRMRQMIDAATERAVELENMHEKVKCALAKKMNSGIQMASELSEATDKPQKKEPTAVKRAAKVVV